jgi:hypothetical protein
MAETVDYKATALMLSIPEEHLRGIVDGFR